MTNFQILADECDYIVAVKPSGISFHSECGPGFASLLEKQLGVKLYPVHRLDKVTSGLLLFAKSSTAANKFTTLFSERLVDKAYLALINQKPKKKQGWVKGDMGKARRGAYKLLKSLENPAITRFYTLGLGAGLRGVILKPLTGKTHQLRVALKSISAPILGDTLYGGEKNERVYLHAYAIRFMWNGKEQTYYALPSEEDKFSILINHDGFIQWQNPWQLEW